MTCGAYIGISVDSMSSTTRRFGDRGGGFTDSTTWTPRGPQPVTWLNERYRIAGRFLEPKLRPRRRSPVEPVRQRTTLYPTSVHENYLPNEKKKEGAPGLHLCWGGGFREQGELGQRFATRGAPMGGVGTE
jgi:hypothetical protein